MQHNRQSSLSLYWKFIPEFTVAGRVGATTDAKGLAMAAGALAWASAALGRGICHLALLLPLPLPPRCPAVADAPG